MGVEPYQYRNTLLKKVIEFTMQYFIMSLMLTLYKPDFNIKLVNLEIMAVGNTIIVKMLLITVPLNLKSRGIWI